MRALARTRHVLRLLAVGLVLVAAGWQSAGVGDLPIAPTEPDQWANRVCTARAMGATPAQTAAWLVGQYGLEVRAAGQYAEKVWAACPTVAGSRP